MGALGPVFRTYEPTRDRLVAVKVFRLDITPEQAEALAGQLSHAAEAELFHPSIVEPIAAGVEGSVAYRAEEYVAAESLDVSMRQHAPAPLEFVLRVIGQLGEAIDVARAAGVGHGALHPRDVFLTTDEARASGFGIVDALERVGIRAPVRRPYSAPERVAGAEWSTPADVFSLAAIAFELLTARRPAGTGEDIGPLTGAVGESAAAVQSVLARAMHENPDARHPSGRALIESLHAAAKAARVDDAPAFADEPDAAPAPASRLAAPEPAAIQMIALPVEAPEFADEDPPASAESASGPEQRPRLAFGSLLADDGPPLRPGGRTYGAEPETSAAAIPEAAAARESAPAEPEPLETWSDAGSTPWSDSPTTAPTETVESRDDDPDTDRPEIADERDADLAQWDLTLEEVAAAEAADASTDARYDDVDVEAAADEVVYDAADLALGHGFSTAPAEAPAAFTSAGTAAGEEPELADLGSEPDLDPVRHTGYFDYQHADDATPATEEVEAAEVPQQVIERDARPSLGAYADDRMPFGSVAEPERPRRGMMPLALALVLGLLGGFAAGYVLGQRRGADQAGAGATSAAARPPETPGPAATAGAGRAASDADRPAAPADGTAAGATAAAASTTPARGRTAAATTPARAGSLSVRTTPPGAAVTIDGRWSGRTPFTRDALSFGNHDVRIVLPGYQTRREAVSLSAGAATRTLNVQLVRDPSARPAVPRPAAPAAAAATQPPAPTAATTGGLEIDSRPAGARVFVDGNAVGTTPLKVADLPPGAHVIRMELPDHRTWTENAQVVRGRTIRVAGSLEPIR